MRAAPLFPHFFDPVPQRVFWDVPWLTLAFCWIHFYCFGCLFGSILASEIHPRDTRSCKAPAKQPHRHPPRKTFTSSGPRAEPCRRHFDPLQARRRPGRVYLAMLFLANNFSSLVGSLRRFPPEESLIRSTPGAKLSSARTPVGLFFPIKFRHRCLICF